jgi:anti-sigma factor RsiW
MTCKKLVELVSEYLEGTLASADRRRFEEHLEDCPYCVTYVEQLRQVVGALGRLPAESISPKAREELLYAFRDWKTGG